MESRSWPCTWHPQSHTLCLTALSKHCSSSVLWPLPWGARSRALPLGKDFFPDIPPKLPPHNFRPFPGALSLSVFHRDKAESFLYLMSKLQTLWALQQLRINMERAPIYKDILTWSANMDPVCGHCHKAHKTKARSTCAALQCHSLYFNLQFSKQLISILMISFSKIRFHNSACTQ